MYFLRTVATPLHIAHRPSPLRSCVCVNESPEYIVNIYKAQISLFLEIPSLVAANIRSCYPSPMETANKDI